MTYLELFNLRIDVIPERNVVTWLKDLIYFVTKFRRRGQMH